MWKRDKEINPELGFMSCVNKKQQWSWPLNSGKMFSAVRCFLFYTARRASATPGLKVLSTGRGYKKPQGKS
jgi:hypothetical protein